MRTYFLPLQLIAQSKWLRITHSAKAILPVLGMHANNSGICWPGIKLIQKLSGVKSKTTIIEAISSLTNLNLIEKGKKGRRNTYILKPPAIYQGGSYFPITEEWIKVRWINLSYIEKAVFIVLAVKATINKPELIQAGDPDIFGADYMQRKKWNKLAGISHRSWDSAIKGLIEKGNIVFDEYNEYSVYK